jgi:hypothetical protein
MKFWNKFIKGSATELTKSVGDALDGIITNDEEKLEAKAKLTEIVTSKLRDIAEFQKEVLVTEISGTKLQRSWRPIVMLAFAFIVVYTYFIAPVFNLTNIDLDPKFWEMLKLGLGGYVIGRSVEKIATTATENIDLTFLKKKDRKI